MKIYTRGGDDGSTSLSGGRRIPKHHIRIDAYGSVDELISWIGLLKVRAEFNNLNDRLLFVQDQLMRAAAALAADPLNQPSIPVLPDENCIEIIEEFIDYLEGFLQALNSFVLPGGSETAAFCHIARCVCRRAERAVVKLAKEEIIPALITRLLNRISDLLFTLGRYALYLSNTQEDKWVP